MKMKTCIAMYMRYRSDTWSIAASNGTKNDNVMQLLLLVILTLRYFDMVLVCMCVCWTTLVLNVETQCNENEAMW